MDLENIMESAVVYANGVNQDTLHDELSTTDDSGSEFRRHNIPTESSGSRSVDGVEMWPWGEDAGADGNWMWGNLGFDADGLRASIGAVPVDGADQRPIVWGTDMDPLIIDFGAVGIPSSIHQISPPSASPSAFTYHHLSSSISSHHAPAVPTPDTARIGIVQTVPPACAASPILLYPPQSQAAAATSYNHDFYKQTGMLQLPPLFQDFDTTDLIATIRPCIVEPPMDPWYSCLNPMTADDSNSCSSNRLHNGADGLAMAAHHDGLMWTDHHNISPVRLPENVNGEEINNLRASNSGIIYEHRDRAGSASSSLPAHYIHHHLCRRRINAFPFLLPSDDEFESHEHLSTPAAASALQQQLLPPPLHKPWVAAASPDPLGRRSSSKLLISSVGSNLVRFCRSSQRRKRDIRNRKDVIIVRALGSIHEPLGDSIPPDSWTWRKYGQKPIKGSKHPRSYYRCTAVKGCKARKRVERWLVDPHMLEVTYFCDHTHIVDNNNDDDNNNCTSPTIISGSKDK